MKKWLKCGSAAIAVAMLASMALTGCGDEPASSGGSTTGESTAAEENTSPLKVSATLQSYGVDDEASQVHQAWLEMMNEKLGRELQLEIDYIPSGEYAEKAKMLISSCLTGPLPPTTGCSWIWPLMRIPSCRIIWR